MKRLLVDMSSIVWNVLSAGIDKENGRKIMFEGKQVQVNGWEYGYESAVNHFIHVIEETGIAPMNFIMVCEGENSKALRCSIFPGYKGGTAPTRPPEAYEEFNKCRDALVKTFTSLGATAVSQSGIEGDDVLAYFALNLKGIRIIDTNDGDLARLIDEENGSILMWRMGKGMLTENPFGPFPCKYITLYKALVGDPGDKLPGAVGFGKTAFVNLLVTWGYDGLKAMEDLIATRQLDKLQEDVGDLKVLQKVIDGKDMVYKSYECATLYPNKVNTHRKQLDWTIGMVRSHKEFNDPRLRHYAQQTRLVHAGNFDMAIKYFMEKLPESPFVSFDIETSSTDVGDEWLEVARAKSTADGDDIGVDVFGAEITGFSLTFGFNMQYTFYLTIDHVEEEGCKNITKKQCKQILRCIPPEKITTIQNVAFELPVMMNNVGRMDDDEVPS